MTILFVLLLLYPSPTIAEGFDYCAEISEVLSENVELGYINKQEAAEIIARCARAPEIEQNSLS